MIFIHVYSWCIFLGTQIDDQVANAVIAQLLFLQQEDAEKDIYMYINSPGGGSSCGWLLDTMQYVKPDVHPVWTSRFDGYSSCAGLQVKRACLQNSSYDSQPLGGSEVSLDIDCSRESMRIKEMTANDCPSYRQK